MIDKCKKRKNLTSCEMVIQNDTRLWKGLVYSMEETEELIGDDGYYD